MSDRDKEGNSVFCAVPTRRFALVNGFEFVYSPLRQSATVIGGLEAAVFGACSQFGTMLDQVARIQRQMSVHEPDIIQCLKSLSSAGMTVSVEELRRQVAGLPAPAPSATVSWLAIPTANRPASLQRALNSYAANLSRFDRTAKMLVSDDSSSVRQSLDCQEYLRRENGRLARPLFYMGVEQRQQFAQLLCEGGELPPDVIHFGLFGLRGQAPTFGANRNSILLATAGEMLLSVDDDTIGAPHAPKELCGDDLVRMGAEGDPTEVWHFNNREVLLDALRALDLDILASHERLLGRPISEVFRTQDQGKLDLSLACGHLVDSIWSGRGSIPITLNGSAGDSGLFSGGGLRLLKGEPSRRRLLSSEAAYRMALDSRELVRQPVEMTVCHGGAFMSMFMGLDNRAVLPPFFPAFRNEDGSFGFTLCRCQDDCYFGYLPWSMLHDPASTRKNCQPARDVVRMSDLVMVAISEWNKPCRGISTASSISSIGRHLIDIASAPAHDFKDAIRTLLLQRATHRILEHLSAINQGQDAPSFWTDDLQREVNRIAASAVEPSYGAPVELSDVFPAEQVWLQAQSLIRRYGELLLWWPAAIERARQLIAMDRVPLCKIN